MSLIPKLIEDNQAEHKQDLKKYWLKRKSISVFMTPSINRFTWRIIEPLLWKVKIEVQFSLSYLKELEYLEPSVPKPVTI